jgi:hypothetical protein
MNETNNSLTDPDLVTSTITEKDITNILDQTFNVLTNTTLKDELFLQYNYSNGNGTILRTEFIDNERWIFRKHEQIIYNYTGNLNVFNKPNGNKIYLLEANPFKVYELAHREKIDDKGILFWLNINSAGEEEGWIRGGGIDPYANGDGAVIEYIIIEDKEWTVIKLAEQSLYAKNGLIVRDKPGLINTKELFQINYNGEPFSFDYYNYMRVNILAMTKERDTINDEKIEVFERTSPWIKIRTQDGLEGWVFQGYLDVWARGGAPKIITPEDRVLSIFSGY